MITVKDGPEGWMVEAARRAKDEGSLLGREGGLRRLSQQRRALLHQGFRELWWQNDSGSEPQAGSCLGVC